MEPSQEAAIEQFNSANNNQTLLLGHDESGDAFVALASGRVFSFDTFGQRREVTHSEGAELAALLNTRAVRMH